MLTGFVGCTSNPNRQTAIPKSPAEIKTALDEWESYYIPNQYPVCNHYLLHDMSDAEELIDLLRSVIALLIEDMETIDRMPFQTLEEVADFAKLSLEKHRGNDA